MIKLRDIYEISGIKMSRLRIDVNRNVLKSVKKEAGTLYFDEDEVHRYVKVVNNQEVISQIQSKLMKEALGIENRKDRPYKNGLEGNPGDENWIDLINKKLAIKSKISGKTIFRLTELGVIAVLGRSVSVGKYRTISR